MCPLHVITEGLGGSSLAARGMAGELPAWFASRPSSAAAWRTRLEAVTSQPHSLANLAPAFGGELPPRLRETLEGRGAVVSTGQQPGLFGGPIYTLAKALTALALADALEASTGRLVAPVFWAATDDADFAEATRVWVRGPEGAVEVAHQQAPTDGIPMADVPAEGLSDALAAFLHACGSSADARVPALVRESYRPGASIGGAYVALLRGLLEPLGIAVLDASDPAVRGAATTHLSDALTHADVVNRALRAREQEITDAGMTPQVAAMPDLSLVFTRVDGRKVRVPVSEARAVAHDRAANLSANVLLRPALERRLLPTAAYVAGPGEFSYFAQVTSVAAALGWDVPLAVPRWSCTIVEPGIQEILARRGLAWCDLRDAHAVEKRLARAATPNAVLAAIDQMRAAAASSGEGLKAALSSNGAPMDPRIVDGAVRNMTFRAERLERRLLAAVKRRESGAMRDVAVAQGALFPGGGRQERALAFAPLLAVHGEPLLGAMRGAARRHAEALVHGTALPRDV